MRSSIPMFFRVPILSLPLKDTFLRRQGYSVEHLMKRQTGCNHGNPLSPGRWPRI